MNTLLVCRESSQGKFLHFDSTLAKIWRTFRGVFIHRSELATTRDKLHNADFKGVLLSSEEHTAYQNREVFPQKFFHHVPEIVSVFNLCIYLHRQSCLTQQINENILNFLSNGLMGQWVSGFVDRKYLTEWKTSEPKVLQNYQLAGAYQLLAFGLLLSSFVFIIEKCSTRVVLFRKLILNYWMM